MWTKTESNRVSNITASRLTDEQLPSALLFVAPTRVELVLTGRKPAVLTDRRKGRMTGMNAVICLFMRV